MSEWDAAAAGWDDDVAVRSYAVAAHTSLLDLAAEIGFSLAGARVCDFGCGTGLLTERLVTEVGAIDAVDASPAMLQVLRAKLDRHGWYQVRTLRQLPDAGEEYELIMCSSVLAFVEDLESTVTELSGRLAPGGLLVHWDWERDSDDPGDLGFTTTEIRELLTGAGLTKVGARVAFEIPVGERTMAPLMGFGLRPTADG